MPTVSSVTNNEWWLISINHYNQHNQNLNLNAIAPRRFEVLYGVKIGYNYLIDNVKKSRLCTYFTLWSRERTHHRQMSSLILWEVFLHV